ncbi:MAG: UDP-N-acetylglucosamine--N-acetylmuramyl-(pentapeptide) pyrophosphoryl-undecaprenol N-acetylglucosamine transferase [Nitrospirae bacterium]|nr:UDP-N-acetylglucosamine--N-acetylmuramyl-(pentapeptide) pyrophosphoryl-undecaprenol N-acetylglucosamine transferase [Nitrospirota bacterium]
MTNTWLSFIVDRVVVSFEESRRFFRKRADVRCLGNPVRPEIYQARQRKVSGENLTLLVFGGSRGARTINRAMVEALPHLREHQTGMTIIHQTGDEDHPWVRKAYETAGLSADIQPYFHRMAELYRRADLVVCRAGATTVAELTAASRPAILIPYPHAARGHQVKNAEAVQAAGGGEMILERDLSGRTLSDRIVDLMTHPERLSRMAEACGRLAKPDAVGQIVTMCRELVEEKGRRSGHDPLQR